jgi:peptidoglycan hydrolase CwlO-like protein
MHKPIHNDAIESLQGIVWSLNNQNKRLNEDAKELQSQIDALRSQLLSIKENIYDNNIHIENYSFSIKSLDPEYDQWFITEDPIEDL